MIITVFPCFDRFIPGFDRFFPGFDRFIPASILVTGPLPPYNNIGWKWWSTSRRWRQWQNDRHFPDNNFKCIYLQYIPRNMHTVFALLCFVVVIHGLIFPYPSGLLHWHCGNLTIAPVPAKQPWWIWINTSCAFIMNDCITTTKQSTTKPCAYFLGYTVRKNVWISITDVCSLQSNWKYFIICSDNGLASFRGQTIIWTNDG